MNNSNKKIPSDLKQVMRAIYDELIDFVTTPPFKKMIAELYQLPRLQRPAFVKKVILNSDELKKRSIEVPAGILLLRSSFGDKRPTLFVVKKYLPKEYQIAWENLNLTFDQDHDGKSCAQETEAWKKPLPFEVQAALSAMNISNDDLVAMDK